MSEQRFMVQVFSSRLQMWLLGGRAGQPEGGFTSEGEAWNWAREHLCDRRLGDVRVAPYGLSVSECLQGVDQSLIAHEMVLRMRESVPKIHEAVDFLDGLLRLLPRCNAAHEPLYEFDKDRKTCGEVATNECPNNSDVYHCDKHKADVDNELPYAPVVRVSLKMLAEELGIVIR